MRVPLHLSNLEPPGDAAVGGKWQLADDEWGGGILRRVRRETSTPKSYAWAQESENKVLSVKPTSTRFAIVRSMVSCYWERSATLDAATRRQISQALCWNRETRAGKRFSTTAAMRACLHPGLQRKILSKSIDNMARSSGAIRECEYALRRRDWRLMQGNERESRCFGATQSKIRNVARKRGMLGKSGADTARVTRQEQTDLVCIVRLGVVPAPWLIVPAHSTGEPHWGFTAPWGPVLGPELP